MSPGRHEGCEGGHGVSDQPPSGAMATPPTAATYLGDLSTPFETSPTTRVTDTLERMLAPASEPPGRGDRARQLRLSAADAPLCERATTCDVDTAVIGPPQDREIKRGFTDGSCRELTPPTERKPDCAPPPESARSRESDPDVMQTTPMC